MVMVFCNYVNVEWMIIGFMALAFFGKGIGALGWAVMADTAPKEISGLSGGLSRHQFFLWQGRYEPSLT